MREYEVKGVESKSCFGHSYGIKDYSVAEFDSLGEFYNYIMSTKLNGVYKRKGTSQVSSVTQGFSFTGTHSFSEAVDLFKNGWDAKAKELSTQLKALESKLSCGTKKQARYDVVGYQASVPRYLQGIPTSMINSKNVPVKNKIITLTKNIYYAAVVDKDTILEESIKALQLVKQLEVLGYRVNLNIAACSFKSEGMAFKVRVKSSGERLNISKLAFVLVNPSMMRRLGFRFIETFPPIKSDFSIGYGTVGDVNELKQIFKGDTIIPNKITTDISTIKSFEDIL